MAVDHIRYDLLAQEALRGVVRNVLTDAAKNRACRASIISSSRSTPRAEACGCRTACARNIRKR